MGYRVDIGFRAKTKSTDENLRFVYCQYMVFLENLWTLHNMGEAKRLGVCLDEVRKLSVTGEDFGVDFVHLLVTVWCVSIVLTFEGELSVIGC